MGDNFPEGFVPANFEVSTQVSRQTSSNGAVGLMIYSGSTDLPMIQVEYNASLLFRMFANGDQVGGNKIKSGATDFSLRIVRDGTAQTWTSYYKLAGDDDWTEISTRTGRRRRSAVSDGPESRDVCATPSGTMDATFDNFEVVVPDQQPVYGPEIGLDVNDEMRLANSSIYMRIPFTIQGDPQRFDEMYLLASYDDGFRAYINGVEVTAQNVPIDATWNSAASGVYGATGGQIPVQQIDLTESRDALRQGRNLLAIHGMNNVIETDPIRNDPDFFFDANLLVSEIDTGTEQVFTTPTPDATNELPAAPAPQIVGGEGIFFGTHTFELVLDNPLPSLEIRYTLDGNTPTQDSTLYTGPITLTQSARLEARAFDTSAQQVFVPGNVTSGTFIALDESLRDRDSDIPLLVLDSMGSGTPRYGFHHAGRHECDSARRQ